MSKEESKLENKQPKTAKGKRALKKRAPKQVEDAKRVLFLQGNKTSQIGKGVLIDLAKLKGRDAMKMSRKNPIWPFEPGNETSLQFFCERADCALFCLANHNNKRPHNLVLGRIFDGQLLDMLELGVERFVPIAECPGPRHVDPGTKPCFAFIGLPFETDDKFKLAKSLLVDAFRGEEVSRIHLMSVRHLIACTATDHRTLRWRHYAIHLKKSGTRIPRIELEEAGPAMDLTVRRVQEAPADLLKEAMKQPQLTKIKEKNVGFENVEGKVGRIYMPKQDISDVALAKGKGVKRARRDAAAARKVARVAVSVSDKAGGHSAEPTSSDA